jgi:hypothetical protein
MTRVSLYTAIYGKYDSVKPVPPLLGVPALLYTDNLATADDAHDKGWTPFVVPHSVATLNGAPGITQPMMSHKWWKTHPEKGAPDADVSIWIDGSMEIIHPDFVLATLDALGEDDWALMPHPERHCIYPEAELSANLHWRYDAVSIREQAHHYESFHPAGWGLVATGFCARRHTEQVLKLSHHWWEECLLWSHQDQLSLPVLLRLFEGKVRFNWNLPWHKWWILHGHG